MTYGISHLTSQNKNYSFTFTSSPFFLEKKISLLVLYHLYVGVQYSPEAKLKTVYIYLYFFYLNLNARLVKMGALDVPRSSMAAKDGVWSPACGSTPELFICSSTCSASSSSAYASSKNSGLVSDHIIHTVFGLITPFFIPALLKLINTSDACHSVTLGTPLSIVHPWCW